MVWFGAARSRLSGEVEHALGQAGAARGADEVEETATASSLEEESLDERPTEQQVDDSYHQAEVLCERLLKELGFIRDSEGSFVMMEGDLAVIGGALGLTAAKVLCAVSDAAFEDWLIALRGARENNQCSFLVSGNA